MNVRNWVISACSSQDAEELPFAFHRAWLIIEFVHHWQVIPHEEMIDANLTFPHWNLDANGTNTCGTSNSNAQVTTTPQSVIIDSSTAEAIVEVQTTDAVDREETTIGEEVYTNGAFTQEQGTTEGDIHYDTTESNVVQTTAIEELHMTEGFTEEQRTTESSPLEQSTDQEATDATEIDTGTSTVPEVTGATDWEPEQSTNYDETTEYQTTDSQQTNDWYTSATEETLTDDATTSEGEDLQTTTGE
jgi:hypothetical protein